MKIRELLSDETKWTKGAFARTKDDVEIHSVSSYAVRWCLLGAMNKCYRDRAPLVMKSVEATCGGSMNLVEWNDAPERTFAEVKALVDKLDI